MRKITHLVVHCSATSQDATVEAIKRYWKEVRKWNSPGYHKIIKANGEIVDLHPIELPSNGVQGMNSTILNVCYIGGVSRCGRAEDNRTPQQKASLLQVLTGWKAMFPGAVIQGHRDFAGVRKDCPSFNAKKEYSGL